MGQTKSGRSTKSQETGGQGPGLASDDLYLFKIQAIAVESFPLPSYRVLTNTIVLIRRAMLLCASSVCGAVSVHAS